MARVVVIVMICLVAGVLIAAPPPQAPPPRLIPVAEWVEQLGVGPVEKREEAEKKLSAPTIEPPEELRAALKSLNYDQRKRAERIVQAMRWNVGATKLPRGLNFVERGQVDLYVAATAVWDLKPDDDRLWIPPVDLGRLLMDKAKLKDDRRPKDCPSSFRNYETYLLRIPPEFKRLTEFYVRPDPAEAKPPLLFYKEAVLAPGFSTAKGIACSLIISRGDVLPETNIQASVIFANGDVSAGGVSNSVIVCDGDVIARRHISQSLVIARGNITIDAFSQEATLIAGGKITVRDKLSAPYEQYRSSIKENETNPLGFITFFELHRIGLEVKVADGTITVSKVAAKSECEKAGLKVGDVILEAAGKKPTDVESLRRLLRDALAIGDASVKLQRGDKTEIVILTLPE